MNQTPVREETEILKELWMNRNPCHEENLSSGEDMFWGTVLMVIKDFNQLSAPAPSQPVGVNEQRLIDYIYEFAWRYGKYYHIGDAEKILEQIKETFQLPEEFLKGVQPVGIGKQTICKILMDNRYKTPLSEGDLSIMMVDISKAAEEIVNLFAASLPQSKGTDLPISYELFNSIPCHSLPHYFLRYGNKEGLKSACLHLLGDKIQKDFESKGTEVEREIKRTPIQDALYATRRFLTTEATDLADSILDYLEEYGFTVSSLPASSVSGEEERKFTLDEMKQVFFDSRKRENDLDDTSDMYYTNVRGYFKQKFRIEI